MRPTLGPLEVLFFLVVLVAMARAGERKPFTALRISTWAGMSRHRDGALDVGPAVGVYRGRLNAGACVAQNRAGVYAGLRCLWLTEIVDTRTGKWETGLATALSF